MKRYEYKFITITLKYKTKGKWYNPVATFNSDDFKYEVLEQAKNGWRFVQAFAPVLRLAAGSGVDEAELIFEREIGG